jgi:hypothetical protein
MSEVAAMQDKGGVDPRVLDERELIALVRATQEEIESHGEWNELKVLLSDLARELLERRVLEKVQLVRLMELRRPE